MSRLNSNLHQSLTEDILKNLFIKKIFTTIDFIDADTKFLSNVTSLAYKDILSIRGILIQKNGGKILTGLELYNDLITNTKILPTFIKSLDELLDGGLISNKIYEICGFPSAGKTQICLTLAANLVQYLEIPLLYIDTKRDFSGKRLHDILNSRNCNEELTGRICHKIKIKQINSRFQLLTVLNEINSNSDISDIKLIIIDSLPAIFYHMGDFNNTLTFMNHFVNIMRFLAEEKNICFVITNILLKSSQNDTGVSREKPALGNYWLAVPHFRLKVTKFSDNCQIELIKSTNLPSKSCQIEINSLGVS